MIFGPAPILDFDGTIADLRVDWASLRRLLGVSSVDDLWEIQGDWNAVTSAEMSAAATARPHEPVLRRLRSVHCFAVLTSNDARAVRRFFSRFPVEAAKLAVVVGRTEMGGPKRDPAYFQLGLDRCIGSTRHARGNSAPLYVGNERYELEFARRSGLLTIDITELTRLEERGICATEGD